MAEKCPKLSAEIYPKVLAAYKKSQLAPFLYYSSKFNGLSDPFNRNHVGCSPQIN